MTIKPKQLPLLLSLMGTVFLLAGCKEEKKADVWQEIRQVKLFTVPSISQTNTIVLPGEVHANIDTPLAFRVAGKVIQKKVVLGQTVKKGQLLAELDASDYLAGYQAASAQVSAANAERQQNSKDLARYKSLLDKGFISPAEYERRKTLLATSNAQLDQTIANAKTSQNQTSYTQLRAEQDGVISDWQLEVGQVISAGQVIGKLATTQETALWVNVPETRLQDFQSAKTYDVKINALGNARSAATLTELSPQADATTRTFAAKLKLPASLKAVAGMSGDVSVALSNSTSALQIPLTAVFNNGASGNGVWVYQPKKGNVHFVKVKVGKIEQDQIVIESGLQTGQQIIAAGANLIHEGQSVKPAEGI